MSAPASAYSYSEYTVAPSEASLNARWYNQIQQWTNRVPPPASSSAVPGETNSIPAGDGRRRRDVDEGTEGGTVLPMHSVSRRASLAERRRWMQQDAEPILTRSTDGQDELDIGNTAGSRVRDATAKPIMRAGTSDQPVHKSSSSKIPQLQDFHDRSRNISSSYTPRFLDQTPVRQQASSRENSGTSTVHKDARSETNSPQNAQRSLSVSGDIPTRPTRGRRPPTPYHPPSDVALTEIPESSVEEPEETVQQEVSID